MKLILTVHAFFIFGHTALNQTMFSGFNEYISLNKSSTYSFGYRDAFDFYGPGTYSVVANGKVKVPVVGLDSIYGKTHIFELLFCKAGKIGIDTENPDKELTVKGKIHAREVKLDLDIPVPDYVFEDDYNLMPLSVLDEYISENGHLPDIPSSEEFRNNGLNMAEMDMMLLKKIEELTLYVISNNERLNKLDGSEGNSEIGDKIIEELTEQLDYLEKQIDPAKKK